MVSSILFLGTQMTVGGAQRLLLAQARWFQRQGYDVTAAFFYDKDKLRQDWESHYPFSIVDLGAWRPGVNPLINGMLLIAGVIRLIKLFTKSKVDVVETFTPDSNILGLLAARLAGVPVRIASHHGYIEGTGVLRKKVHGWMINHGFCYRLVAVSERVKRMVIEEEGVKPDKVVVILNGIEPVNIPDPSTGEKLRKEIGLKSSDFVYLTVSRLTLQKGHTYLLEAVPIILNCFPENTIFLFVGEGHQREILEKKMTHLGLTKKVQFLGVRKDIPGILSLADVFVLPSLWEGLPLALLEAMSVGLPVVATRVEGVESIINDGENGYLVPPKDVQALAKALIKIRANPESLNSFGKRNADLVERSFTNERMCANYETLFLDGYSKEIVA